jgi:hypothetical protein
MARVGLAALLLGGCATVEVAPDHVARATGAVLTVRGATWRGRPWDLAERVTALAVELRNDSAAPLRVSFVDLTLTDEKGRRRATLDPFFARQPPPAVVLLDGRGARKGFHPHARTLASRELVKPVAPSGHATWVWPWFDPPDDVLAAALPEGILPPGARVEGWLFFDRATPTALTWRATTVEGNQLSRPSVPLTPTDWRSRRSP